MKRLGVFLLPQDGMLVHRRFIPSIEFASTHLYTWVERGIVKVKCLAQENSTLSPAIMLKPGLSDAETSMPTTRPCTVPQPT